MNALWIYFHQNQTQIASWTVTTVILTVIPLIASLALALPIALIAVRRDSWYRLLNAVTSTLYTIPSLVLFLVLPTILDTKILSPVNVAVALTVYGFSLLARSVAEGLRSVPQHTLEAGLAMGQTPTQQLLTLKLPLALPVIAAGIRVATVSNVSLVSVASIVGVAQLGELFTIGSNTNSTEPIILGLVLFIILALIFDGLIVLGTRAATPWRRAAA